MSQESISDAEQLENYYGTPSSIAKRKDIGRLDEHCRRFIATSPFLVLASAGADGTVDASPRGDAPGFVAMLDDSTLAIPDRPGNRRVDSLSNIVSSPNVGVLFFVPGMNETLRVNGRARISRDPDLLASLTAREKLPLSVLVISVEEVFLHCAKALIRSELWNPERQIDRKAFPTLGKMLADQLKGIDADGTEDFVQKSITDRLY